MTRARLLMAVALVAGAAAARHLPDDVDRVAPCAHPAWRDGLMRCDGEGDAPGGRAWLVGAPLDVNRARARDLERVSGIGPSLAARIVAARDARGGFTRFDDLDDIDGIGPATLAKLRGLVDVVPLSSPTLEENP